MKSLLLAIVAVAGLLIAAGSAPAQDYGHYCPQAPRSYCPQQQSYCPQQQSYCPQPTYYCYPTWRCYQSYPCGPTYCYPAWQCYPSYPY